MIRTTTDTIAAEQRQSAVLSIAENPLHEPILRVLIYYDIFLYPLTSREVYLFIQAADVLPEEVEEGLHRLREDGILGVRNGYWFLRQRGPEIVTRRLQMEEEGARMWKMARRVGRLMKMAPFVRGIFISGQLSRYIADEQSDIDYFIVTEPGRLWIVRTFFVLCRRILLLNNRKYFCTNYFVTTDNLLIRERNIYTACETTALKPLWNRRMFRHIVAGNRWVSDFYPNFSFNDVELREGVRERRSQMQRLLEALIPKRIAARLDKRLMEKTRSYWRRKFPDSPARLYETSLRSAPNESRGHSDDQSVAVLNRYGKALALYGIAGERYCAEPAAGAPIAV